MDLLPQLIDEMRPERIAVFFLHSTPFWGFVFFLFKHYFRKTAEAHREASERLIRIEASLHDLSLKLADLNPNMIRKEIEKLEKVQRVHDVEIKANWEAIKQLQIGRRRAYDPAP